jgi:hypothetical protein
MTCCSIILLLFPLDLDSTYERKCDICLSKSGLFCFTWWSSPLLSIFLQITFHFSFFFMTQKWSIVCVCVRVCVYYTFFTHSSAFGAYFPDFVFSSLYSFFFLVQSIDNSSPYDFYLVYCFFISNISGFLFFKISISLLTFSFKSYMDFLTSLSCFFNSLWGHWSFL